MPRDTAGGGAAFVLVRAHSSLSSSAPSASPPRAHTSTAPLPTRNTFDALALDTNSSDTAPTKTNPKTKKQKESKGTKNSTPSTPRLAADDGYAVESVPAAASRPAEHGGNAVELAPATLSVPSAASALCAADEPPAAQTAILHNNLAAPLELAGRLRHRDVRVLIDSGAAANIVSADFVRRHNIITVPDTGSVKMADGHTTAIERGIPRAHLSIGTYQTSVPLSVVDLGLPYDIILGQPWLIKANPSINWTARVATVNHNNRIYRLHETPRADYHNIKIISSIIYKKEAHADDELYLIAVRATPKPDYNPLVQNILKDYADVFPDALPNALPPKRNVDFKIDLEPGHTPPCRPTYKLGPDELKELRTTIDDLLSKGHIKPSVSPFGAPILFVKKKDGTKRMVIDYRALNRITIKNKSPLPRIDELLDTIGGNTIFTKLDLMSGYHQFRVADDDTHKTAFRTRYGLYEFTVLPFGLTNAPATFMTMMNDVLRPYLDDFVIVFIDDILIYSKTPEQHDRHVRKVLDLLRANQLYAKKTKCSFFKKHTGFLGYIITDQGTQTDPKKIQAVQDWPTPKTVTDVRRFHGFAAWYRKFVKDFSTLAAPLNDLNSGSGNDIITWTDREQASFDALKTALTTTPVLVHFDPSKPTAISTDASDVGIGAELSQDHGRGFQPVAFESRKLSPAEKNYPTHEKELLAIVHAFKTWAHYLHGRDFTVYTDHRPLTFIQTQPHLSRRQARWLDTLQEVGGFNIKYKKGVDNTIADALSRLCENQDQDPQDGQDTTHRTLQLGALSSANADLHSLLLDGYAHDAAILDLIDNIRSDNPDTALNIALDSSGLLYDTTRDYPRLYVPDEPVIQSLLLHDAHDAAGHFGTDKTFELLSRHYFWPRMRAAIKDYVQSCEACQRNKTVNAKPQGLLQPIDTVTERFHTVTMDLITGLPTTKDKHDAIVVFVDKFTKLAIYAPITKEITAPQLAQVFFDQVYRHYGLPKIIISDRDPRFTGAFWQCLFKLAGTKLSMSTAYHPQSDGQTERANRTLVEALRSYVSNRHDDWDCHLPLIEFAYNNTVNASTGHTPFYLAHGYNPRMPISLTGALGSSPSPAVTDFVNNLRAAHDAAALALRQAQTQQKRHADKRRRETGFAVGDSVLLNTKNLALRLRGKSGKLHPRYIGPFPIIAQHSPVSFKLDLPPTYARLHPTFHASLLRPYKRSDAARFPNRDAVTRPPPLARENRGDVYSVEVVLDAEMRIAGGARRPSQHFLVKWLGYPLCDCTWEPAANLKEFPETWAFVEEFLQRQH